VEKDETREMRAMPDTEKVISTLEEIKTQTAEIGLDSAVIAHKFIDKIIALLKEQQEQIDRLLEESASNAEMAEGMKELLKEQEAVKPQLSMSGLWYECPICHRHLLKDRDNYCARCGRRLKWE
jgi:rubrerythrin